MRIPSSGATPNVKSSDPILLIFRRHTIRPTPVRRAVLEVLLQTPFALSGTEVEKQLAIAFDRITLYRTLRTFEDKRLVHRVIDDSETVRYAAYSGLLATSAAIDHVHFKCTACRHIYCLSQVAVPVVELPGRYQVTRGEYLVSGVCEQCQVGESTLSE